MNKTKSKTAGNLKVQRPTIALIADEFVYEYQAGIWSGVLTAAEERDVNLICFTGKRLRSPTGFEQQANVIYDLVSAESVDGLVIMSSAVGSQVGPEGIQAFCESYRSMPVVSVGALVAGVPSVLVDNEKGLRDVLVHLIENHGARRIAFIGGPVTNEEAELRYRTYVKVLTEYNLPTEPDLVAYGDFLRPSGTAAINLLLDERKVNFEAVVVANDNMALGALEALQERGIRVPYDMTVVGFDDVEETRFVTPPLTTVRQPLHEQGRRATEILLALINGSEAPEQVVLHTELVVRQSCGCPSQAVVQAFVPTKGKAGEIVVVDPTIQREALVNAIVQALGSGTADLESGWAEQLTDTFLNELQGQSSGGFFYTLEHILHQAIAVNNNITIWQNAISVMRRHALIYLNGETLSQADNLCQQARVIIGETADRVRAYQELQAEQQDQALREVGQALITTFDTEELTNVLAQQLPHLNIPSCYLSLYEDPRRLTEQSRLKLAFNDTGRIELEEGRRHFPSCRLVPEGILPSEKRFTMIVTPLYFKEDQLGFTLFEVGPRDGIMYEALRGQISSALQGASILQERRRGEEALAKERNLLRTMIDNLPDYIYQKDTEGRFVIANTAVLRQMGLTTLDELVGKSDFDFFPRELAERYYTDEQSIIQSGQPLLDYEGPTLDAGKERWISTTKVPIQDEKGRIAGFVGMGKDITERKLAEEKLRRNEKIYRSAISAAGAVPYYLDYATERYTFIGDDIYKLTGYTAEEITPDLLGKLIEETENLNDVTRLDRAEAIRRARQGELLVWHSDNSIRDRSGQMHWFTDASVQVTDVETGKPIGAMGALFDITERKQTQTELEQRAMQLLTAAEISRAASSTLDPNELIQQAVNLIRERFNLYYVGLFLVDQTGEWTTEAGRWAVLRAGTGEAGQQMIEQGHKLEVSEASMIGWCVKNKQARIALDVGKDAVRFKNPLLPETRSEMALPLVSRGEAIGALTIQSERTAGFSDMEVTILQTLADQLTNAITNARLYNQAQTALKEVEAIYRRYMAQEWTKYVRTRPTSGFIQSQGGISPLGNELLPGVQQAMEKLQPIVDIEQEQPVLVVPVKLRDQPIGAIGLKAEASGRHWSDDDITLIETLSEQLALAAENIRLLDETQRRAEREHIVSEITTRLRATNNPQTILQTAAGELRRALNAKNARILIQSPKQSPEQPLEQDNKEYDPVSALDETLASIKKVIPSEGKHDIHNRGGK